MPSPTSAALRETRILRGVLLITLACGFFVVMNTGAKVLSAHLRRVLQPLPDLHPIRGRH